MNQQKINVVTLGCSKNVVDSEHLMGQLSNHGFKVVFDVNELTDIVIINTCGFIADAKEESINTILQFSEGKKDGDVKKLIVMGCLSQRYREELSQEMPEVDLFLGVDEQERLLKFIIPDYKRLSLNRDLTTPGHYAYLKIAEGCSRQCAFCSIPGIRGPFYSVSLDDLMDEAVMLADKGVKELILIAQDLTYYGKDKKDHPLLPDLLEALIKLDRFKWIRLQYAYPVSFPGRLTEIIKINPSVCSYLDIPFQHSSDKILKAMRRGHTRQEMMDLIYAIRREVPGIALRTTLLVGFPGETEEDFMDLMAFVKEVQFDRLGVFIYSHEEGTPAGDQFEDDVPAEVKKERAELIMDLQQSISLELNQSKIGSTMEVIIDGKEGDVWIGRTQYDSPEVDNNVLIADSYHLKTGSIEVIEITDANEYDLFGIPVTAK